MIARRFSLGFAAFVLFAGGPLEAWAQSFDCAKAATPVERLICADAKLGDLDVALAAEVKKALAAGPEQRDALLAEERRWVKERDRSCAAPTKVGKAIACLTSAYEARIAALKAASEEKREASVALGDSLASAQTIDCMKAATEDERLICSDRALMALDVELARELNRALAAEPGRREELLGSHKNWSWWKRRGCCGGDYERSRACLVEGYRKRIDLLRTAPPIPGDRLDICRRLGARYSAAFEATTTKSRAADRPLEFLAETPGSGLVLAPRTALDGSQSVFAWADSRRLTLAPDLRKALADWSSYGEAFIEEAPAGRFVASEIAGTAYCYSQVYFKAENGRAALEDGPEGWDQPSAGCGANRWLGRFEGTPAAFEEDLSAWHSLSARVTVARRVGDRFAPECQLTLAFGAQSDASQAYDSSDKTSCEGSDCESLRRATVRLVDDILNASVGHRTPPSLTPAQNEAFAELKKLAEKEEEKETFAHAPEEFFPLLHEGRLYVAGVATMKDRRSEELLDRIVTLSQSIDGRLAAIATFVIPVSRGRLVGISVK